MAVVTSGPVSGWRWAGQSLPLGRSVICAGPGLGHRGAGHRLPLCRAVVTAVTGIGFDKGGILFVWPNVAYF
ncbi:hypothetical protein DPMN_140473 [Dreissena polymorpha]|uniref:Uncharacterized protein n=1 Tax=Dreissena polymorpha TaxID=45954 RepID=A0A9D4GAX5_DREPO|nr:hypothetical protein DPMN_140473 [Dreissena polymorpha]